MHSFNKLVILCSLICMLHSTKYRNAHVSIPAREKKKRYKRIQGFEKLCYIGLLQPLKRALCTHFCKDTSAQFLC